MGIFKLCILNSFCFLIYNSLIQLIYLENILGFEYDTKRLTSVFGEEKILGSYLSRFCNFIIIIYVIIEQTVILIFIT